MNDDVLMRFADRFLTTPEPRADEAEAEESAGAFGYLRGARERSLMLELRLKGGNVVAFSYGLLDRAAFDPSDGIFLHFAGQKVRISGRSLNEPAASGARLFDLILRHKVTWVRETARADIMTIGTALPVVDMIEIDR